PARLADLVTELVRLPVRAILVIGTVATRAAQQGTTTIPIITISSDPVGNGFAASLAHPGGNITGLSLMQQQGLGTKWLELLHETVPSVAHVGVLATTGSPNSRTILTEMERAAIALGVGVQAFL